MEALATLIRSMAWTMPVAIFFAAIGAMLLIMTAWQIVRPTVERKGFLPMTTTRGDRLFIGLLGSAYIHLAFIGFTDLNLWIAFGVSLVWMAVVMKFG
jgi:predicted small integral membrane protein